MGITSSLMRGDKSLSHAPGGRTIYNEKTTTPEAGFSCAPVG